MLEFNDDIETISFFPQIVEERYQKVSIELKHTVETLHEESERVVKIEAIKKSLEIEVKNLSIRLEEVEANAIVGGKRIISKLEARVSDLQRLCIHCTCPLRIGKLEGEFIEQPKY